ncbi:MAG: FHA domain-containing protein, partial [Rhodobacterales bacterium]|nr:FHA domain-containing protein [Rhodobacterales bacterium]
VVDSRRLSRIHAQFVLDGNDVRIRDMGSTNGTLLNGERIERSAVLPEDEVTLGSVVITIHDFGTLPRRVRGVERHERFLSLVSDEITRARTFGRGLTILMIRSLGGRGMISRWVPRIQSAVRVVDQMGLSSPDTIEILMPESDVGRAMKFAQELLKDRHDNEPALACGVAAYPSHGSSAQDLSHAAYEALGGASLAVPVAAWRPDPKADDVPEDELVVDDAAMRRIWATVDRIANSNIIVLVGGETGVGKEIIARGIHERSSRRAGPMRAINCGAIPRNLLDSVLFGHEKGAFTGADRRHQGVFEEADGGTVLLDEVGELSAPAQVALLRFLETRMVRRVGSNKEIKVDVRLVAATHRDLREMSEAGDFREDLYYRLNQMEVLVPPLRERSVEIGHFVNYFIREANRIHDRKVLGITPDALTALEGYLWPGNVRELRNAVERAVVITLSDYLTLDDLPQTIRSAVQGRRGSGLRQNTDSIKIAVPATTQETAQQGTALKERLTEMERELIGAALVATSGNQTQASALLQMPRRTLVFKMKAMGFGKGHLLGVSPWTPAFDNNGNRLGLRERLDVLERELIVAALQRTGGKRRTAADLLQIQKRTLDLKIGRYGL